jgi:uncharacterized YccA/Bax inhibitor family protein
VNTKQAMTIHHIETMAYGRCIQKMQTIKEQAKLAGLMFAINLAITIVVAVIATDSTISNAVFALTMTITTICGGVMLALIFSHGMETDRALKHKRAADRYDVFKRLV